MADTAQGVDLADRFDEAAKVGMHIAVWAEVKPNKVAIYDYTGQDRTWGEMNANANRIARRLREAGIGKGDAAAILVSNRAEFCDAMFGCLRAGVRFTPVNWHLTPEEIAYVVNDCEAKALFADVRVKEAAEEAAKTCANLKVKIAIGGPIPGFEEFETLKKYDGANIDNPIAGYSMLYTSGTTGRPKGVHKPGAVYGAFAADVDRDNDRHLCTGPAYHAAPLAGDVRGALSNGLTIVFVDKWDSEQVLAMIDKYKITHSHMVAIMFQRLLGLPEEVKAKYDISSLKRIRHGAAPCPPEVKHAVIKWLGPIIGEYYAGSEGGAGFSIDSHEWLKKPGSVGKRPPGDLAKICDEQGAEVAPNVVGQIWMKQPTGVTFTYYKDEKKTLDNRMGDHFTLGDYGYFDDDGYLFLTGRSAETIIAGGVNIYPQEIDNELIKHPQVEDSCTIGIPHDQYGEEVRAVIQLKPGVEPTDEVRQSILMFANEKLAKYKVPRGLDFIAELPRNQAGKALRQKVRAPYWAGRTRQI
jgi:long-chain acyl-CoA synthetase